MNNLKQNIFLGILACFLISFQNKTSIIGQKYSGYTKHSECEMMKTTLVLNENKTFEYNRFCESNSTKENLKKTILGNWKEINNSNLILTLNDAKTWVIHIKSEETIEISFDNRKSNFTLKKEK